MSYNQRLIQRPSVQKLSGIDRHQYLDIETALNPNRRWSRNWMKINSNNGQVSWVTWLKKHTHTKRCSNLF